MLKRSKRNANHKLSVAAENVTTKSAIPLSSPVSGHMRTIIAEHMSFEGSIRGEENLEIMGSVNGNIELEQRDLIIGPKGRMKGEIRARNVTISGELKGNVKALDMVEVKRKADFYGEINAKCIAVEDGACFKGVIELDSEPRKKSSGPETASSGFEKGSPMTDAKKGT